MSDEAGPSTSSAATSAAPPTGAFNFSKAEEKVLEFWKETDAFQESMRQSTARNDPPFNFYDGPPFATGTPHYGHILAGTIKDTVTRYAHQTGHHVDRRFGWDCHGLPVEYEIDKTLGITGPQDVEKMGIAAYNAECRKIVMRYSGEWRTVVTRLGRWIDFDNDYKTLYPSFMESVWNVFQTIHEKELVYRGFKVMPYSTGCCTPLSNFEATSNYKEVSDPAVFITFPLRDDSAALVAWTTTPWTLPSNLAVCVHPTMQYVRVRLRDGGKEYICLENRLPYVFGKGAPKASANVAVAGAASKRKGNKKREKAAEAAAAAEGGGETAAAATPTEVTPASDNKDELPWEILERMTGADLAGREYEPLFDYYASRRETGAFRVLADGYVTDDSGSGVVHCAPFFGEDDYRVCLAGGVISRSYTPDSVVCPLDAKGCFTAPVTDFEGVYVKTADKEILIALKKRNRVLKTESIKHQYPYCWRSDTPLLYRAVPSWFIAVEKIKDRLVANNNQTHWVPNFVKEGRFHNWLVGAQDWAVSRNRYWGTPIPLWTNEDFTEIVCIGSIEELSRRTGVTVTDLHRESIDDLTIPSENNPSGPPLRRISEVFDCWFESGSMPYAQAHYPFENKESFESHFPAQFIAEGIDQTRGWFYTLMVLSTILFDKPAFQNVIVNGIVLNEKGDKMSKRLKNYPDPMLLVDKYGADAVRMYLINSPVVRAESLKFSENGVKGVLRDVFIPLYNACKMCLDQVQRINDTESTPFVHDPTVLNESTNTMDVWMLSYTQTLVQFVHNEMEVYRLYTVMPRLVEFVSLLTNWYVRLNRRRLKGETGVSSDDSRVAVAALFEVLLTAVCILAPFTPFLSETLYQQLRVSLKETDSNDDTRSVHFLMLPQARKEYTNESIERGIATMQRVIDMGRYLRESKQIGLKYPLAEVIVINTNQETLDDIDSLEQYIREELNVKKVTTTNDREQFGVQLKAQPDSRRLGARMKDVYKAVHTQIIEMGPEAVEEFCARGTMMLEGQVITTEDVKISPFLAATHSDSFASHIVGDVLLLLDIRETQEMRDEGIAREVVNRIQRLRKSLGLKAKDLVSVYFEVALDNEAVQLARVIEAHSDMLTDTNKGHALQPLSALPAGAVILGEGDSDIKQTTLKLALVARE